MLASVSGKPTLVFRHGRMHVHSRRGRVLFPSELLPDECLEIHTQLLEVRQVEIL